MHYPEMHDLELHSISPETGLLLITGVAEGGGLVYQVLSHVSACIRLASHFAIDSLLSGNKIQLAKSLIQLNHNSPNLAMAALFAFLPCSGLCAQAGQFETVSHPSEDAKLWIPITDWKIEEGVGNIDRAITPSSHSVIESDRFRDSFTSLPEILDQEIGVQVRSTGGEGSQSTVILRGASTEQVIIYLDGVPLNDASGGPVDLSFISVDLIERIEIYRGSTPLELGSPSIGGAVNIITRKVASRGSGKENSSGQISAGVASHDTYKLSGTSSLSHKNDDVLVSASYLQSKNDFSYINDNGTQFNTADDREETRNNDGVKQLSLLGNWQYRIDAQYDTELRLDVLDREKQIPGVSNSPDVQALLDTRQYNALAQLNAREITTANIDLNIKFFASRKDEVFDDTLAQIGFFDQHTESVTTKGGAQAFAILNQDQAQWKLLTRISRESYNSENIQALVETGENKRDQIEISAENVSYFFHHELILNLIVRYQRLYDELANVTDDFGVVTPGVDKTYDLFSPQLGAKYRFSRTAHLAANIGIYNRAPSFLELFGGDGLLLGNTDLEQETSLNTDLGFTYRWLRPTVWLNNAEIYIGVFYNRIENLIVRIFNGQGLGVPQNISDAVIKGFESTIQLAFFEHHNLSFNLSLIDSINQSDISSFNDKVLPGYYQQSFGLRYTYSLNRWVLSAEADIKRNMFYDRSNLLKGDDVNRINFAARRNFNDSSIDLRVDNVLDENIQYFRNRPTPGITVSLTFNQSF